MRYLFEYAVESSICLALFMTFYYLLLRKDTQHGRNRVFLILSLFASLILPLLSIDISNQSTPLSPGSFLINLSALTVRPDANVTTPKSITGILPMVYAGGLFISFISLLLSVTGLLSLILINRPLQNKIIKLPSRKPSCFSAFGYIFISADIPDSEAERMILHELNHIRKNHFFDLTVVACTSVIQWFNPAVYFLRKSLEAVHEFEADQECIRNGEEISSYQSLLVSVALGTNIPILTNKFSDTSILKKRIIMMTKKKTGRFASMKILLAAPLAALMFFTFSCKDKVVEKEVVKAEAVNASPNIEEDIYGSKIVDSLVFVVVEQMPQFPGGDAALMKTINENIKYPDIAKEKGIQGKVICKFCIDETGKVIYPQISRGVDPVLDRAAYEVIKSLPDFRPGTQGGKPVKVWYSLPINFQLK